MKGELLILLSLVIACNACSSSKEPEVVNETVKIQNLNQTLVQLTEKHLHLKQNQEQKQIASAQTKLYIANLEMTIQCVSIVALVQIVIKFSIMK